MKRKFILVATALFFLVGLIITSGFQAQSVSLHNQMRQDVQSGPPVGTVRWADANGNTLFCLNGHCSYEWPSADGSAQ